MLRLVRRIRFHQIADAADGIGQPFGRRPQNGRQLPRDAIQHVAESRLTRKPQRRAAVRKIARVRTPQRRLGMTIMTSAATGPAVF